MKCSTVALLVVALACSTTVRAGQTGTPTNARSSSSPKHTSAPRKSVFSLFSSGRRSSNRAPAVKTATKSSTSKSKSSQRRSLTSLLSFGTKKPKTTSSSKARTTCPCKNAGGQCRCHSTRKTSTTPVAVGTRSSSSTSNRSQAVNSKTKTRSVPLTAKIKSAFRWKSRSKTKQPTPAPPTQKSNVVLASGQVKSARQTKTAPPQPTQSTAKHAASKGTPKRKSLFSSLFRRNSKSSKTSSRPQRLPELYSHKDPGPPQTRAKTRPTPGSNSAKQVNHLTPVPEYHDAEFSDYVVVKKRNSTSSAATKSQQIQPARPGNAGKWDVADPFNNNGLASNSLRAVPASSFDAPPAPPVANDSEYVVIKQARAATTKQNGWSPKTATNVTWQTAPFPSDRRKLTRADKVRLVGLRKGMTGFKGFCPVELIDHQDLIDTRSEFNTRFGLKTYHFSSAKARETFERNPTRYIAAAGGLDVITLSRTDREAMGSLDYSAWYKGRLYLFSSKENQQIFQSNPALFSATY